MVESSNFLSNKYTRWYFAIIANAQNREVCGYTEKHHIIPKSLGGGNEPKNLVKLTAREHFICHWLLTKMVSDTKNKYKMWNAFSCMIYRENDNQHRYKITSKKFEAIKKTGAIIKSKTWSKQGNPMFGNRGESNPLFGKKQTPEHIEKLRQTKIGRKRSEESKKKQSMTTRGRTQTEEHVNKRKLFGSTNGMFGKKLSPETIAKRQASRKANTLAKKLAEGK
jgi:hypothetical protein